MKRVLSAVVFLPVFIAIVYWGPPILFFILLTAAVLLGVREYFSLTSKIGVDGFPRLTMLLSFLLILNFYFGNLYFSEWFLLAMFSLFAAWFLSETNVKVAFDQIAYSLMGALYVAGLLGHLILIRNLENGGALTLFMVMTVWMGDTAAYYIGRTYGKRRLAPAISPGKTVEGAAAGLLGSMAAGGLAKWWLVQDIALVHCLIVALICGMIGQLGDLAESLLKRNAGAKDSGGIVPGHGGVLDRSDSLMFAGPAFYCYYQWIISP